MMKKIRFTGKTFIIVGACLLLALATFLFLRQATAEPFEFTTILSIDNYVDNLNPDDWEVSVSNSTIGTAEIKDDMGFEGYSFIINFKKPGTNIITLKSKNNSARHVFEITIDKDKNVDVQKTV